MEGNKEFGWIYILTNKYMPGLVKIGKTTRRDLSTRMKELYTTGVPYKFESAASCKVPLEHLDMVENELHCAFNKDRIGRHEFFAISPEQVKPILNILQKAYGLTDANAELQKEINDTADAIDIKEEKRKKLPNMDFFKMGLRAGDTLTYTRDNNITCTIATNRTVNFRDQTDVSLTKITKELLGYAAQPSPYWLTKDGISLFDIYNNQTETDHAK